MPSKTEMSRGRGEKACLRRNHLILGAYWGYTGELSSCYIRGLGWKDGNLSLQRMSYFFLWNHVKAWMQIL